MRLLALGLLASGAGVLPAQFDLAPLFTDHMVLQRGMPVPVFGRAAPGTEVEVRFGAQRHVAKTGDDGRWLVRLAPLESGEGGTLTVRGPRTITCADVAVGEVWICSGQSNMEWPLARAQGAKDAIAAAGHPQLRLFQVARAARDAPQASCSGHWSVCTPQAAEGFSAVAYFFGRRLHADLGVPVGLVQTAWGGTRAEAWTSEASLRGEALAPIVEHWRQVERAYPRRLREHEKRVAAWRDAVASAKAAGTESPQRPNAPVDPARDPHRPANLFHAMVHPLIPFAIRGVIWYQGEANVARAAQYDTLLPSLIEDWRRHWGQGDFPFLLVQLAAFRYSARGIDPCALAELWEAQSLTAANVPNTALASAVDLGNPDDIHPADKQTVGERLARAARVLAFGGAGPAMGPRFAGLRREGTALRLEFDFAAAGLVCKGEALTGFQVCGADRVFHPAAARIDGAEVVVAAEPVAEPVAVRYAWHETPVLSLYGAGGLPASPFRSDRFQAVTAGKVKP